MEKTGLNFPPETVAVFVILSVVALLIDMMAHKKDQEIKLTNAVCWSIFWVAVAVGFGFYIRYHHGVEFSELYFTGYALEKALSIDNLFLMMAIFSWFKIPDNLRHRVLYWGIIGAIVFRAIFVAIGTSLLALGPWVEIVFAVVIAWTAIMMLRSDDSGDEIEDYSNHLANRLVRKFFPVWPKITGNKFFISSEALEVELQKPENQGMNFSLKKGMLYATPLFLCLAVVELSDIMFAFDSVPAIIAVSKEPIIIYSAMMFAILGLRTMYFVLEALRKYLIHLEKAVIALLFFISAKLLINATDHFYDHAFDISANMSLWIILGVLTIGVLASFIFPQKIEEDSKSEH